MYDPGYANYQDPRLQPRDEPEGKTCADCHYFKDVERRLSKDTRECVGACVFDVFQADTFDKLYRAELLYMEPTEEPCTEFKDKEDK